MLFDRSELKPLLHRVASNDPTLTSLHLCHKNITNKQLLQISDALQSNTSVTEIWLTNNQISDDVGGIEGAGSVGYLASVLESNTFVGEVYLGGNKIGAKGASSIANLLQHNNTITDIGLEDNAICDDGAKILADVLTRNNTLQTLKLRGNDIKNEKTLETISGLLKKNRDSAKRRFKEEKISSRHHEPSNRRCMMDNRGYAQAVATHDHDEEQAVALESNSQQVGWTSSPPAALVQARIVFQGGGGGATESTPPYAYRGDTGRSQLVEYRLHPVARLAAFLGFLLAGVLGVVLGFGALMLPMMFDSPHRTFFDNLWILGFIVAYLGCVACLLAVSALSLSAAMSGVLAVSWEGCDGRVPCPGGLGLGDLFSSLR